jgi:adenylate cyclase
MLASISGRTLPIYYQRPSIQDAGEYVAGRLSVLKTDLRSDGELPDALASEVSEPFLDSLAGSSRFFAVISVDLVGSTQLSASLPAEDYLRLVTTFLNEMGRVVPIFQGHVLKYVGDGLVAYFPEPSFLLANDLAVDCALTMRRLVVDALNPAFSSHALPTIAVRIGVDSGDAPVATIGSSNTRRQSDIIGATVNRAAKTQGFAAPNSVYVGEALVTLLHTDWRRRLSKVPLGPEWMVTDTDGKPYPVFQLS